ncbi:unnamed protein product [Lathyrus oleraceus]
MKKACFWFFFILLTLLTSGMVVQTEGRRDRRESRSHRYKEVCLSDHSCESDCRSQGFSCGECRRFRRGCYCRKNC